MESLRKLKEKEKTEKGSTGKGEEDAREDLESQKGDGLKERKKGLQREGRVAKFFQKIR